MPLVGRITSRMAARIVALVMRWRGRLAAGLAVLAILDIAVLPIAVGITAAVVANRPAPLASPPPTVELAGDWTFASGNGRIYFVFCGQEGGGGRAKHEALEARGEVVIDGFTSVFGTGLCTIWTKVP